MKPIYIPTFLLLFLKGPSLVYAITDQEIDAYFSKCDKESLQNGVMAWDNFLSNGDWIKDKTKEDVMEHCQNRIEAGKKVVAELQECLADEIKDGLPEFTQIFLTLLEELCNNDSVVEKATREISAIIDEDLFHECFKLLNLELHLMKKDSSDMWRQRLCCIWARNWECLDQVLSPENPETRSQYLNHFDFYYDEVLERTCVGENMSMDQVCATIQPLPASHGQLIFYKIAFVDLESFTYI